MVSGDSSNVDRFLKDAETRYAIVELEALAIYWAIRKCRMFLAGLNHFTVITDHKPLKPIFNDQMLNSIENAKILSYRSRLSPYNFTGEWKCGKDHFIPDALSRAPISNPDDDEDDGAELDRSNLQVAVVRAREVDLTLENLSAHARECPEYCRLKSAVEGNSVVKSRSGYVTLFKKVANELSVDSDLVLRGSRIVVPPPAIKDVLNMLHSSHQGVERTKRRARQIVFWPGFSSDIANMVESCSECAYFRPSNQPEPLIQADHPSRPFEMVTADFFSYGGSDYLVLSCRFSGFPFIQKFTSSSTASSLIKELRDIFAVLGVPNVFRSDNATVFASSLTQDFFKQWGIVWRPSSPHHPQSNGHAESNVKSLKYLLPKCGGEWGSDEFVAGLMELRNTPRSDGLSPAQHLFGRPMRTQLPVHWRAFLSEFQLQSETVDSKRLKDDQVRKAYFDRTSRVRKKLSLGEHVLVQNPITRRWDKHAKVVDNRSPRRYLLQFPSGRLLERNLRFLRRAPHHGFVLGDDQSEDAVPRRKSQRERRLPDRLQA
ncbi:uncharacterized protein K02A2.6-like [Tigriopus californicus]|uniref:uncharacterized protein K02A2.6-like n=1 Tax=Tigriopus californicus TaxID=6832 RepID=UPI0027DA1031|nr:uncharacterized protein K02A2.6-like [Tigriopus californicus]